MSLKTSLPLIFHQLLLLCFRYMQEQCLLIGLSQHFLSSPYLAIATSSYKYFYFVWCTPYRYSLAQPRSPTLRKIQKVPTWYSFPVYAVNLRKTFTNNLAKADLAVPFKSDEQAPIKKEKMGG